MDCLSESSGRSILSNEKYFSGSGSDDNNDDENDRNSVYESPSSDNDVVFDPSKGISEPDPNDVICGRGKMTSLHPANRRFRELVNENKDAYQRAKRRDEKTRITYELVDKLRIEGRYGHLQAALVPLFCQWHPYSRSQQLFPTDYDSSFVLQFCTDLYCSIRKLNFGMRSQMITQGRKCRIHSEADRSASSNEERSQKFERRPFESRRVCLPWTA